MPSKSKSKGNNFENGMYKELREIIPDIKLTIGSGNSESDADLISDDYIFELKRYKRITATQMLDFWRKVKREGGKHNRRPFLLFKEDYRETKIMLDITIGNSIVPAVITYDTFVELIKGKDIYGFDELEYE
jgi:hypothetical protein